MEYTKKRLRSFGLTVGGIFLVIGMWPLMRRGLDVRLWAMILGGVLVLPGLIMPTILRQPYKYWMKLAHVLGWINTKVILTVMFYVVFTPAAFVMRLLRKDPMNRRFDPNADTYRVPCQPREAGHMRHQF